VAGARLGIARLGETSAAAGALARSPEQPDLGSEWVRLDDAVLVWDDAHAAARSAGLEVEDADPAPEIGELRLVSQVGRIFEQEHPEVPVVLDKGRFIVVRLDEERARQIDVRSEACWRVRPLTAGETVFRTIEPPARAPAGWIQDLVDGISRATLEGYLTRLASFRTRHSLSDDFTTAATWARDELQGHGFGARLEPISVGSGESHNVVADQQGGGPDPRGLVVVTAHLDSINQQGGPSAPAPGADDNASGSAAVLEMGRLLAGRRGDHDLRLILFGGEEEGLFGSHQYVDALPAQERDRLRAVVNMDMVGTVNTPARTVLIEGAEVSRALMDELAGAAATYTSLVVQTSLNPFASDHVPFIEAGLPAVLTIEGADSGNGNVHTAEDTLAHIDYELALEIVRMNLAVVAGALGGEPPA
jgi:hypothetical protein